MNFRHAAALALMGWYLWYLMMPPWGETHAPLSTWAVCRAHDSAQECQADRDAAIKLTQNQEKRAFKQHTESGGDSMFDPSAAVCISTDDPRLKEM